MNGETGVVVLRDDERERVTLARDDGRVLRIPYGACRHARARLRLSVHKAQGSQNRAVVMVLVGRART